MWGLRTSETREERMQNCLARAFLSLLIPLCGVLAVGSRASAAVLSYETVANVSVTAFAAPSLACGEGAGVVGSASAAAACSSKLGGASAFAGMGLGLAGAQAYVNPSIENDTDASAYAFFSDVITITGTAASGALTWEDSGITGDGGYIILEMGGDGATLAYETCGASDSCENLSSLGATIPVTNGEEITLYFEVGCGAEYEYSESLPQTCNIVDPMSLTLSPGLSYTSAYPGFLKGGGVPEPSTWALCVVGLLGLSFARRRLRPASPKRSTPASLRAPARG
jgi:PEP-CTERM motif-containing protein